MHVSSRFVDAVGYGSAAALRYVPSIDRHGSRGQKIEPLAYVRSEISLARMSEDALDDIDTD